jgi:hypothetical protein
MQELTYTYLQINTLLYREAETRELEMREIERASKKTSAKKPLEDLRDTIIKRRSNGG